MQGCRMFLVDWPCQYVMPFSVSGTYLCCEVTKSNIDRASLPLLCSRDWTEGFVHSWQAPGR